MPVDIHPDPEIRRLLHRAEEYIEQGVDYGLEGWKDAHTLEAWMKESQRCLSKLGGQQVSIDRALWHIEEQSHGTAREDSAKDIAAAIDELVAALKAVVMAFAADPDWRSKPAALEAPPEPQVAESRDTSASPFQSGPMSFLNKYKNRGKPPDSGDSGGPFV